MPRNLELKVPYAPVRARKTAKALGARDQGILHQTDTYFAIGSGRLKVREIKGVRAEVIWYRRPNRRTVRTSHYRVVPISNPRHVKRLFTQLFTSTTVVVKSRRLFLYENARIHVDRVRGLGSFLEFEVVMTRGSQQAKRMMRRLRRAFVINPKLLISSSYGDLKAANKKRK